MRLVKYCAAPFATRSLIAFWSSEPVMSGMTSAARRPKISLISWLSESASSRSLWNWNVTMPPRRASSSSRPMVARETPSSSAISA
jgi:hypothetical protein